MPGKNAPKRLGCSREQAIRNLQTGQRHNLYVIHHLTFTVAYGYPDAVNSITLEFGHRSYFNSNFYPAV